MVHLVADLQSLLADGLNVQKRASSFKDSALQNVASKYSSSYLNEFFTRNNKQLSEHHQSVFTAVQMILASQKIFC